MSDSPILNTDFPLLRFSEVGSTMDKARELVQDVRADGLIILADIQRAGRGRLAGRVWEGNAQASLFMTLCLKKERGVPRAAAAEPSEEGLFPLKTGLAVLEALSELEVFRALGPFGDKALPFRIKWPNDIMGLRGSPAAGLYAKLGGILCEGNEKWLFAGIGLNVGKNAYSSALKISATSLEETAADAGAGAFPFPDNETLARSIGRALASRLGKSEWRADYESVMWGLGDTVVFSAGRPDSKDLRAGTIAGVDDCGRLRLVGKNGAIEVFWSGEISAIRALD